MVVRMYGYFNSFRHRLSTNGHVTNGNGCKNTKRNAHNGRGATTHFMTTTREYTYMRIFQTVDVRHQRMHDASAAVHCLPVACTTGSGTASGSSISTLVMYLSPSHPAYYVDTFFFSATWSSSRSRILYFRDDSTQRVRCLCMGYLFSSRIECTKI